MPSTRLWLPIPWGKLDKKMKKHIFYTGPRGIGKSTLLQKRLAQFQGVCAGFRTVKVPFGDSFSVHMLPVDKRETPAEENFLFCRYKKRMYEENALRFNAIGCRCLADLEGAALIVMDELGSAESAAAAFQDRVLALLDGEIPVLGVLQEGESAFQQQVATHPNVELIYVTEENRDSLS